MRFQLKLLSTWTSEKNEWIVRKIRISSVSKGYFQKGLFWSLKSIFRTYWTLIERLMNVKNGFDLVT